MKVAAIGIGSNSLRMLVAEIDKGQLVNPRRYRRGLRVFAALDTNRNISAEMIQCACASVLEFKYEAIKEGVEKIHLFATSAVRDAANQDELVENLKCTTGLSLDICSGDEEASLSYWGAADDLGSTGMIDIGGGSTELALGCGGQIKDAVSLQMGAVRLYRAKPISTFCEAEEVIRLAEDILEPVRTRFLSDETVGWVGVGGTFTTCAAIVQRVPWEQRHKIHRFVISQQSLLEAIELIAPMTLEERLQLKCLQPQRADIVVHGMAILMACMKRLHISTISVSEHGNLEGYLKQKYVFKKI